MAVKTTFEKVDFETIFSEYDLGEYLESKPLTAGAVQTNFLVITTVGKFILRYYENRSKESALFESDLIEFLKGKNYPCPAQFKNRHAEFVSIYKNKPYAIFEFIDGEHLENPDNEQKQQLIEKVAELQNFTKNYIPTHSEYRWNYSIELCEELAQKEADKVNTKNVKEKLIWFKNELQKIILPKSLPKGICHCDFHFSNVLFKDGKFRALIDFDDANYTYLTFDLASLTDPFVSSFRWDTWSKFKKDENVFDFDEAKKTVQEYEKYRLLSSDEREYLYDVYKLSLMLDCIWRFERGDVNDFYERRKIDYLNGLGRKNFYENIFGTMNDNRMPTV